MDSREKNIITAINALPGMGSKTMKHLYEQTGNAEEILNLKPETVKEFTGRDIFTDIRKEWISDPKAVYEKMEGYVQGLHKQGIRFVTEPEENYPARLRNVADAPFGLYYLGTLPEEERPTVSIIGARECSEYGRRCAELFGKTLAAKGVQIISGMARGIDGISQKAALDVGGNSFGVLGCGVDICYPKENQSLYEKLKQSGGIISEYIPGTQPKANLFPARNRIISALADILLVIEARMKSGTYITVCQALEQGREIYALPGRITDGLSDGCNRLIKEGAGIASSPEDILEMLRFQRGEVSETIVSEPSVEEKKSAENPPSLNWGDNLGGAILRVLEETPKPIEELMEGVKNLGYDPSYTDMLCKLMELTLDGKCSEIGNSYSRIRR